MNQSKFSRVFNYSLNKFFPMILIGVILFVSLGFFTWEPYAVMGLLLFSQSFHFKVGYSVAICEERGFLDEDGNITDEEV
tara:strand:+ start:4234 stop:4473 length:240 start_codon:yes stop_codon:yes gene_type:complete